MNERFPARESCRGAEREVIIRSTMNEQEPPPIKYPPWVRKEILLPILGFTLLGLVVGNYLVFRSINKERRYSPAEYGPMDHAPATPSATTNAAAVTNSAMPKP